MKRLMCILMILFISGCGSLGTRTVLHPIDKQDIALMPKDKAYTPDRDGYFVSKYYLKEVINAKAEY